MVLPYFFVFMKKDVFENFNFDKCIKGGEKVINVLVQEEFTIIEGLSVLAIASEAYKEECANLLAKAENKSVKEAKKVIDGMFNEFCIFYEGQKSNEETGDPSETVG